MRGSGTTNMLFIQLKKVIRKPKKIKSKSQKFRIKNYKISILFSGCYLVGSSGIESEIDMDGKIDIPITLNYSHAERV